MVSGADINDPAAGRVLIASADGGPLKDCSRTTSAT